MFLLAEGAAIGGLEALIIGGAVAGCQAIIAVSKVVGGAMGVRLPSSRSGSDSLFGASQASHLDCVYNVVKKTDDNGTPLVYVPRGCSASVDKMVEQVSLLTQSNERVALAQEGLTEAIRELKIAGK